MATYFTYQTHNDWLSSALLALALARHCSLNFFAGVVKNAPIAKSELDKARGNDAKKTSMEASSSGQSYFRSCDHKANATSISNVCSTTGLLRQSHIPTYPQTRSSGNPVATTSFQQLSTLSVEIGEERGGGCSMEDNVQYKDT